MPSWLTLSLSEAAAITLRMTYGYTIDFERPDPLTTVVDEAFRQAGHAGQPGAWLVDLVPARKARERQ